MHTTLHNRIMRRVYYAFARRIVTHPITVQSGLFVLALMVFARTVHVRSIIGNFLSINVGQVPTFLVNAVFQHGEVLTLIAIGVMIFTLFSLPLRIRAARMSPVRVV